MAKSYSDKLKDPRWQKKRLKILERDNWMCQNCGDSNSTLHVHHKKYKGNPWDVENKYLETLCESCHSNEHKETKRNLYEGETNQLVVKDTRDFIIGQDGTCNKDHWKGPYTIMGELEQKVEPENNPPEHILISSGDREYQFQLIELYADSDVRVVIYEFIGVIK